MRLALGAMTVDPIVERVPAGLLGSHESEISTERSGISIEVKFGQIWSSVDKCLGPPPRPVARNG